MNGEGKKIVCPSCKKPITEQVSVEIATSEMVTSPIARGDRSFNLFGTSLFFKNGKYYLIFETACTCPHCHNSFELDIPIELADLKKE